MTREGRWLDGVTWVFQGTVAEDATAGTHVVTLTVTPGAGNDLSLLYGQVTVGATATAQTVDALIDDGTNVLTRLLNSISVTTSSAALPFPQSIAPPATSTGVLGAANLAIIVSGTMRLILKVTTTAVSVTQTFAVVSRALTRGTATLNDTIGASTNVSNTNKVF